MDLAIEERDHDTRIFLQWYVTEQPSIINELRMDFRHQGF